MKKTFDGNYFEDFDLADDLIHGTPRTVTQGDVSLYIALTGSRYALHCAETIALACGFKKMPIDNLLAFHIAFGKTVPEISLNAVANLGYAECAFVAPVFVNDTLSVVSKVIGLKENSNGTTGNVYVHSVATNQHQKIVLEWKRWVMVNKRIASAPMGINSTPKLLPYFNDYEAFIPANTDFSTFDTQWNGNAFLWQDYQIGECIDHVDGMTINESDHSLATRLYQNNAKVHFDQQLMKASSHGQRLVYGGHIISLARALSFNGLANAIWIAAINGGTHANPCYAGDTLYCKSQIIDKGEFNQRKDIGWLRIKTFSYKNDTTVTIEQSKSNENGKSIYHKSCVLELDYTVLMPK